MKILRTPPPRPPQRPGRRQRFPREPYSGRRSGASRPWQMLGLLAICLIVLGMSAFAIIKIALPRQPAPAPSSAVTGPGVTATLASPTTAASMPSGAPPSTERAASTIDVPALQQYMVELINADRRGQGLGEVAWDNTAAAAGQDHAQEMAAFGYLSHLNLEGHAPDYRYTRAGGLNSVRENVYEHSSSRAPHSADEWRDLVRQAEAALMNSPGHRANILDPTHTHVGIGIAYDATSSRLSIAQEFSGHYVGLDSLPLTAAVGARLTISGRILSGSNPLLNMAYEPAPTPKTIAELNASGSFSSPAESYATTPLAVGADGRFSTPVTLDAKGQAGLYHVRVFVDIAAGQALANDVVIEVR